MKVVEYIKEHGIEKLTEEFAIKVKEYPEENLLVLNYDQIKSPKMHPIVIECRGLILDTDLNVVCRPFDRFFNIEETKDTIDFIPDKTEVFEKVDGSLIKVYYYNNKWNIATRGTAFAESDNYTGESFESLVIAAFGCDSVEDFQQKMKSVPKGYTHIFEYVSPKNKIVTPYTEDKMVLLSIRCNKTGIELGDYDSIAYSAYRLLDSCGLNVRAAKAYYFDSKEELLNTVQNLPGLQEGFVLYKDGKRVKIKSDTYVRVHRLRGDGVLTPKRIAELVVVNEVDEYLSYFSEDEHLIQQYVESYNTMLEEANDVFLKNNLIKNQKDFAMSVKNKCYSGILFSARKNNTTPYTEFVTLPVPTKIKILLIYKNSSK